jgi:hypothetical protein
MSTGRGRGGVGGAAAAGGVGGGRVGRTGIGSNSGVQIPASALKVVQSLKEIVRNSDDEIYSMLKICNMDLNETVQRLLNDDNFHEVKRKRDKKKEVLLSLCLFVCLSLCLGLQMTRQLHS